MIRTVAEFLLQLKDREARRLDSMELSHAPTIGDMYEGLSKELLTRAIPASVGLQLVSGFISDGLGGMSGQIDCMLVSGQGEVIPYTDSYKWHIKDVIAVLEIKKTLYGADLADAFIHLRKVRELESSYIKSLKGEQGFVDVRPAQRAFAETTGVVAPAAEEVSSLKPSEQLILKTLILEQLGAIRVVFGYNGFRSEKNFRESLIGYLGEQIGVPGFGVLGFPQLIISGGYSLGKANGRPFSAPLVDNQRWPFYYSASTNPLQLLLEYIWTRLARDYDIGGLWGEDLAIERLHQFMSATVQEMDGKPIGWNFYYRRASDTELAASDGFAEWEPTRLSAEQFATIQSLCRGNVVRFDDPKLITFLLERGIEADQFRKDLLKTGLVAVSGKEIELITEQCQCAILPNGELVAGENNTGRLTRWMRRNFPGRTEELYQF